MLRSLIGTRRFPTEMLLNLKSAIAAVALLVVVNEGADAAAIVYTISGTASGSFRGNPFSNAEVTLTAHAETADIMAAADDFFFVACDVASVSVSGAGSGEFTNEITATVDHLFDFVTIADTTQSAIILGVGTPSVDGYDLSTSVGPLSGNPATLPNTPFPTTSGTLVFTDVFSAPATFRAQLVPEASFAALLGVSAVVLACRRSRKLRLG